jgi:flagellar hook assembly protein FlgD
MRGEQVRTLVKAALPAGAHHAEWDGTNDWGRAAASGVYIYRLRTPEFTGVRMMVLAK